MTTRRSVFGITALAAIAVIVTLAVSAAAQPRTAAPTLIGTVGKDNAYKITMANSTGKMVTKLKAGTYKLVIHDDSALHNYELDGPHGKSWTFTTVPFTGTKTFTLKLGAGAYKAYCAPHEATMFQHFSAS